MINVREKIAGRIYDGIKANVFFETLYSVSEDDRLLTHTQLWECLNNQESNSRQIKSNVK